MSLDDRVQEVRSLTRSFRCAFRGVWFCVVGERNMRIHLVVAAYVLVFSVFYGFSAAEYAVLLLAIGMVIGAEAINTAVEAIVNMEAQHYDRLARLAKDAAAGGVLVCAIFAAAVGLLLFIKPSVICHIAYFLVSHPVWGLVFLASLPAGAVFIFLFPFKKNVRRFLSGR